MIVKLFVSVLLVIQAIELISGQSNEACIQPKKVGKCRGSFPRYWFNSNTNRCEFFIYGGCDANKNNFETIEQCQATCSANQQSAEAPPKSGPGRDTCSQPKVVGKCRAMIPRFWYNADLDSCESFFYGGCDGNENNFLSVNDCVDTCLGAHTTTAAPTTDQIDQQSGIQSDSVCEEPKIPGKCRGYFPRFWYNSAENQCQFFVYGGCGGNGNNFETEEECKNACMRGGLQAKKGPTGETDETKRGGFVTIIYKIYHFFIPYSGVEESEETTSAAGIPVISMMCLIVSVIVTQIMGIF